MMKKIILIKFMVLLAISCSLAQKSRGISLPGTIGMSKRVLAPTLRPQDILCKIVYADSSGDNILSEGEVGNIVVSVNNLTLDAIIQPKLVITMNSSWEEMPKISTRRMKSIEAGTFGTYLAQIYWDNRLPAGVITFSVIAIDRHSGVQSEPAQASFKVLGAGSGKLTPDFADVDQSIPQVPVVNAIGIAVVIGNCHYQNPDVPEVDYALNDARLIRTYLKNMLGYQESNILFYENASKSDFERVFGTREVYQGKLYNYVKPHISDVFIYYNGHGAPGMDNKKAYFMPIECDPNYIKIDGYSLEVFYRNIEKIPAKSVTIILDACFSGGSQQGLLWKHASPMYIDIKTPLFCHRFNLFTSASGDQIASWFPERNHSLFTYYFLRAIRGEADMDRDRKITVGEIEVYVNETVPYMARRLYGREQTPWVQGRANTVICSY